MELSFSLTDSAANEIRRLFDEVNNPEYLIKVFASKNSEGGILLELIAIEPDEHSDEKDLLFTIEDIKVSVQRDQIGIFNRMQLDFKVLGDSQESLFIFSKTQPN